MVNNKNKTLVFANEQIRSDKIVLLADVQAQDGKSRIMSKSEGINYAKSLGLDLIQISYDKAKKMAICRCLDYGKYKYDLAKKDKETKKKIKENEVDLKTVQFSIATDEADKLRLLKQAREFLVGGGKEGLNKSKKQNKVKLTVRFRNRSESRNELMFKQVLAELIKNLEDVAECETKPSVQGREYSCILRAIKK